MRILTIENKKDNKFLRKDTSLFDFDSMSKEEIRKLIRDMKGIMNEADGIGLAANQIGIQKRFFIADLDGKFYAIFNPEIVKESKTTESLEQGCLSVPEKRIEVERPSEIVLKGYNRNGKRIKIKTWGMLAHVFQHEVDHLNGKLITDYKK